MRRVVRDSYTAERRPHVAAVIQDSVAFDRIACITDPNVAAQS